MMTATMGMKYVTELANSADVFLIIVLKMNSARAVPIKERISIEPNPFLTSSVFLNTESVSSKKNNPIAGINNKRKATEAISRDL